MKNDQSKRWLFFDIILILLLLISVVLAGIYIHHFILEPVFFISIGILFLTSNVLREKLYTSCVFFWIADNIFKPRTKINHIISGIFCIFIGLISATIHIDNEKLDLYKNLGKSKEFWVSIVIAVIFNILVGLYTYTMKKRKLKKEGR